jgi:dihydrofolate reductase
MRKLISSTLMSVNGVIGNPHEWAAEFDAESAAEAQRQLERSHALLMGRRTYEIFSALWPAGSSDYAAAVNGIRKYVFSSTLRATEWSNSTLVSEDAAAAVALLKQEGDDDLVLYGYGRLGRSLRERGLIDELKVWTFPRFVPTGTLMFQEGDTGSLELVDTTTTSGGVVVATYRPR